MEITVRNVNEALPEAMWRLKVMGVEEPSRNGPVLVFPEPVTTIYEKPQERVLFWGERDANPIFHCLESIWMLAGRRDVAFPQMFNSRIDQYSDDGENFNAAYGYRWRHHFGFDQLKRVIEVLQQDSTTRQAVVQMWEASDLGKITKDKACNMQVIFEIRAEALNMTVINRSNDMWYGAYGANAVHFSVLQEFVAGAVGVPIGVYRQYSHNLHLYTELYDAKKYLACPPNPDAYDKYRQGVEPMSLGVTPDNWEDWLGMAELFCLDPYKYDPRMPDFLTEVCHPMAMVSKIRKSKAGDGYGWARSIHARDWQMATLDWVERRENAKKQ